jgi:hypothetical protein
MLKEVFNWGDGGELEPSKLDKLVKSMASEIVTVCNYLHCRLRGVNVHATKKALPSERNRLKFQEAFNGRLQRLIAEVHYASVDEDGKKRYWAGTFPLPIVVTGIVLASNRDVDPIDPNTEASSLSIDDDIVTRTLDWLKESTDSSELGFSPAIAGINTWKKQIKNKGGTAPNAKEIMACFVNAHSQLLDDGAIVESVVSSASERKKLKATDNYVIYGGVDQGRKEESKDDEESEG